MKLIILHILLYAVACCYATGMDNDEVPTAPTTKPSSKQDDNEQSITLNNVQHRTLSFYSTDTATAASAAAVDEENPLTESETMQTTIAEPWLTGRLQQQLIQKYAGDYKQIPRVTTFTCHVPNLNGIVDVDVDVLAYPRQRLRQLQYDKNLQIAKGMTDAYKRHGEREVFVNFVHIDELANMYNRDKPTANAMRGGVGRGAGGPSSAAAARGGIMMMGKLGSGRKSISKSDWLDSVLDFEALRHIVVVDLACGPASRVLLKLASDKMLFSAKIHWLLIEDYAMLTQRYMAADSEYYERLEFYRNSTRADTADNSVELNEWEPIEIFMERLNLYVNTELTLAQRHKVGAFRLHDVWNPGLQYGGSLNMTEIGSFALDSGLRLFHWFQTTSTVLRRKDMQLARIRVMNVVTNKNVNSSLEAYLTTPVDVHIDSMNRFNYNLLLSVKAMFNMSFVLMRSTSWGYLKNGKFDGMIGAIIRKQVDLAGSPIFYYPERHKFIDAAARTWTSRPCFIFRHPRSTKKDRIVFLQPFSDNVWLLLAICGLGTVLILWLLATIELKLLPNDGASLIKPKGGIRHQRQKTAVTVATVDEPTSDNKLKEEVNSQKPAIRHKESVLPHTINPLKLCLRRLRKIFSRDTNVPRSGLFLESVIFYVGIICQQGLGFSTSFISGRCVVITSLLFSFCIYQFYSASIVGTLLMEKPKTIRTLTDLVHSSLQVGVEDILYNRDFFLRTKDPVAMELYAKKITNVPNSGDNEPTAVDATSEPTSQAELTAAEKAKSYREILHSHEKGAHAKSNEASNWLDPESGMLQVKKGRFAFHTDVATAYKIIGETFTEREICDLAEISLFPPQKTVSVMQKNSPLRKVVAYGLRRVIESGIMSYHIKVWHSRKPPCVKQLETSDLHVDMETVSSALLLLIFGYVLTLIILGIEIVHFRCHQRYFNKQNDN